MRSVRADQPWLSNGRIGAQITAHVARRNVESAQTCDLEMRKILADPTLFAKYLFRSGAHVGHFGIEFEITVDAGGQFEERFAHRASSSKRLRCVGSKLRPRFNARRLKPKLERIETSRALIDLNLLDRLFPGNRFDQRRPLFCLYIYLGAGFNHEFLVRLLDGKEVKQCSEKIGSFGHGCRNRFDVQLTLDHVLVWQGSRTQTGHMLANRDRLTVLEGGAMNDSVPHRPIVMGNVRAWLK